MGIGFLIVVGVVVFAILRFSKKGEVSVSAPESKALGILADRFARGEIDAETYRSMKAELGDASK